MSDFEDRLRALLHTRADAVDPSLSGASVRFAAERRRGRLVLPLAAAAIVALLAVSLTFVLNRDHSPRIQPGGGTTQPSRSVVPHPSPSATPSAPTVAVTTPDGVPTSTPSSALPSSTASSRSRTPGAPRASSQTPSIPQGSLDTFGLSGP